MPWLEFVPVKKINYSYLSESTGLAVADLQTLFAQFGVPTKCYVDPNYALMHNLGDKTGREDMVLGRFIVGYGFDSNIPPFLFKGGLWGLYKIHQTHTPFAA